MARRVGATNVYSAKTRIGNWSEDVELEQAQKKEFLARKNNGGLLIDALKKRLAVSLQDVPMTYSKDGTIRVGDNIMLYNAQTQGVLSVDIEDKLPSADFAVAVTTSTNVKGPVARNVFVLESASAADKPGQPLRFGQAVRFRANPALTKMQLYLTSQPKTFQRAAKVSRNQEVSLTALQGADTLWKIEDADACRRFENQGKLIPANADVVIVHAQTGQALFSDKIPYANDFGNEFEVSAFTQISVASKQGLLAEKTGKTTIDVPVKAEQIQNHWSILTAAQPEMEGVKPSIEGSGQ